MKQTVQGGKGVKPFNARFSYAFFLSSRRDSTLLEKAGTGQCCSTSHTWHNRGAGPQCPLGCFLFLMFPVTYRDVLGFWCRTVGFPSTESFSEILVYPSTHLCPYIQKSTFRFVVSVVDTHNLLLTISDAFAPLGYQQVVSIIWPSSSLS